jgi:glycine oxidase
MSRTSDVVIAGGGVIGCAVAWTAARRGLSVTVVERDTPGRGASWAAAGMLSPAAEIGDAGPFLKLARRSLDLYPDFVAALRETTGEDPAYTTAGKVLVARDAAEARELGEMARRNAPIGIEVELLEPAEARRLEPALTGSLEAAALLRADHLVDNRRLGSLLWSAAARAGVQFELGERVVSVESDGPRVSGVRLAGGRTLPAERVVVTAGCWSGELRGLPRPLPVRPVRGQMIALESVPPLLERTVGSPAVYLVPRRDGRVLVGATVEEAGYRATATAGGVHTLLSAAMEIVPGLAKAPIVEVWAGLRPGTPDDLPILGADPELSGLFYATGHFRNGILLAPVTAVLLTDLLAGEPAAQALASSSFGVDRFGEGAA